MADIFISYSRKDKAFVQRLHESLETQEREVWIDWENIPLTAEWLEEIYNGIEAANAFAFVISPDSVRSEVCNLELVHAIDHNKRLIPVLHRELTEAHDMAALHPRISSHNWLFFRDEDNFDDAFKQFIHAMDTDLEHLQMHTRLLIRSVEWHDRERDGNLVLRGDDLRKAARWLDNSEGKQPEPTSLQRDYIDASLKAAASRRRAIILVGVYGFVVLALAVFAFWQAVNAETRRRDAEDQRALAEQNEATAIVAQATSQSAESTAVFNEQLAQSLALASNAQQVLYRDNNPALAIALALAAVNTDQPSPVAQNVLAQAAYSPGQRRIRPGFAQYTARVSISPDGDQALSVASDNALVLWDIETGEDIYRWPFGENDLIFAIQFSPDGKRVYASAGATDEAPGFVVVYDVDTKEEVARREDIGNFFNMAFTPDGKYLASGLGGTLIILDALTLEDHLQILTSDEDFITYVTFSPDGKTVFAAFVAGYVRGWTVDKNEQVADWDAGLGEFAESLAFMPDGTRLLVGYGDGSLLIWDLESGQIADRLIGHTNDVWEIVISPDGALAFSASYDTTLIEWNLQTNESMRRFTGHGALLYGVAIAPDARRVISGSADGTVRVWDVDSGAELNRYEGHAARVWNIASFIMEGGQKAVISASADSTLVVWDANTGEKIRTLEGHEGEIFGVDVNDAGTLALSGSGDTLVILWDINTGKILHRLAGHEGRVRSVSFSPDGTLALSSDNQGVIILWDLTTQTQVRHFEGHEGGVWGIDFSPDGTTALSASVDGNIILWDVESGQEIWRFVGHQGVVYSATYSPDGHLVLSGSEDRTMRLWDIETGTQIRRFDGHTGAVRDVSFSPDGTLAMSVSEDRRVSIWNVSDAIEILRFEGHTGIVIAGTFGAEGNTVFSGSDDATVRRWQIQSLTELIDWTYANRAVTDLTCEQRELYRVPPYCDDTFAPATATPASNSGG